MSEEIKEEAISFTGNLSSEDDTDQSSFEKKIEEAKKLLEQLTDPEITLSKSVEVYKKGMGELEQASKLLEEAKLEFVELSNKA